MRGGRGEGSWGLGVSNSARIFKRFRNHVRNNLNRCAVNDSIQTRQTRSIKAQQRWRGSILPFLLNLIQCICTPTPLILVTLTPRSSLHPSLGVLIYLTSYHEHIFVQIIGYCIYHPSNILQHTWKKFYEQLSFFFCLECFLDRSQLIMKKYISPFHCNNHKKALSHLELIFIVDVRFEIG